MELNAWRYGTAVPEVNHLSSTLQNAINEQRSIGWSQFLEGFISKQWSFYMSNHFRLTQSKMKGTTWAAKLIKLNWQLIFNTWECRNKQLFNTKSIEDLQGVAILQTSIQKEISIGLGSLPASQFSHYLTVDTEQLFQKSIETQLAWFTVVRQGRIMMDPYNLCNDAFSTSKSLQAWAEISYQVQDSEGLPILLESIHKELEVGQANLPPQFTSFLISSPEEFRLKSTSELKRWFKKIKTARMQFDPSNLITDTFSYPGALRDWVGLTET